MCRCRVSLESDPTVATATTHLCCGSSRACSYSHGHQAMSSLQTQLQKIEAGVFSTTASVIAPKLQLASSRTGGGPSRRERRSEMLKKVLLYRR